jgi:DNA-binding response OmpR family regulator
VARLVLVVDDEADLAATCSRLLRRHGYAVVCVGTIQEGVAALTPPPDLIVADLRLPDGDGLDVVRAACRLTVPPPVIVVTGHPSAANRTQAMQAGASAFLTKPFAVAAFVDLVQRLLPPVPHIPPPGAGSSPGDPNPAAPGS